MEMEVWLTKGMCKLRDYETEGSQIPLLGVLSKWWKSFQFYSHDDMSPMSTVKSIDVSAAVQVCGYVWM